MARSKGSDEDTIVSLQASANLDVHHSRFALVMESGPGAPREHLLGHRETVIGRGLDADFAVDSAKLSRRHARVVRFGEDFSIEDLDSRNGVVVNGVKVHSATLREGDTIHLGDVVLKCRVRG